MDIIQNFKDKFDRIFDGEDPNYVFNRKDVDGNGNVIKLPVDKEFLVKVARAIFGDSSSDEVIRKIEKLSF